MKESGKRIIFWGILWLFALIFGITGFIISGDYKDIKFLESLFGNQSENNNEEEKINIELSYVNDELNNYLDGAFINSDYVAISSVNNNKISVSLNSPSEDYTFDYIINGTTLYCNFASDPTGNAEMLFKKIVSIIETKYYGVSETDVTNTLNSDEINNYTLSANNIEINKQIGFSAKLNVNKVITIISAPSYIQESSLQNIPSFMDENEVFQITVGNIILYKSKVDGKINLSIFEKGSLTENSYKSLISAITILYGNAEANLFKVNYPNLSTEDYAFDNYEIKIKPTFTVSEAALADSANYQLIRIIVK